MLVLTLPHRHHVCRYENGTIIQYWYITFHTLHIFIILNARFTFLTFFSFPISAFYDWRQREQRKRNGYFFNSSLWLYLPVCVGVLRQRHKHTPFRFSLSLSRFFLRLFHSLLFVDCLQTVTFLLRSSFCTLVSLNCTLVSSALLLYTGFFSSVHWFLSLISIVSVHSQSSIPSSPPSHFSHTCW